MKLFYIFSKKKKKEFFKLNQTYEKNRVLKIFYQRKLLIHLAVIYQGKRKKKKKKEC
jgi:hypothetical protein